MSLRFKTLYSTEKMGGRERQTPQFVVVYEFVFWYRHILAWNFVCWCLKIGTFFVNVALNSILSISVVKCSKNWSFDLFRKIHLVLLLSSELLLSTMRYSHFCSRASAAFEHQHYCTTYTVCAQRLRMDSQLSFESHPKQI